MKNHLILGAAAAAFLAGGASAGVVAFSSFEELAVFGGVQYVDTLDPLTDHALLDNDGQPFVNYAGGAELGFSSFYTNTRDGVGLSDGDFVGVTDFTGTVGAYTDGLNGFQISDSDGLMTVTMQSVDLTGVANASMSLDLFVQDTGYEDDDRARVWVEVDGGEMIDLFAVSGDDLETSAATGQWLTLNLDLSAYTTATIRFELDSNSGSEAIYVDNILVVPTPGALALLGLAGLAGSRRRRG
jgi:hypothetical protein